MKRIIEGFIALLAALLVAGCGTQPVGTGWITLIDGDKGLENFNRTGDANWRAEGGAIVADKGKGGLLVSKQPYTNFMIYAEFYAETSTNSGIFIRAADPNKIGSSAGYEVNIWDSRADPSYGTGAIVNFASVPVPIVYKAGGRWNTLEVTARGPEMSVVLNGVEVSRGSDAKFAQGPFALQFGNGPKGASGGAIKWRRVEVLPL